MWKRSCLPAAPKQLKPAGLTQVKYLVAAWIPPMLWLERYLWIAPVSSLSIGAWCAIDLLIATGFPGGFAWGWIAHVRRFPIAALASPPERRQHA